jgi:DNA-binding response OmpR family regulator
VIVLSAAQVNSASIRKAYELGASSYFVKGNVPMAHIYSDLAARLVERGTGRPGSYRFGRLEFDPTGRTVKFGRGETHLTQQQTALVLFLAQGSKSATARDLIEAGLFQSNAAHSTVHSALLTLRRRLDELEPGLGQRFVRATARGYNLVTIP